MLENNLIKRLIIINLVFLSLILFTKVTFLYRLLVVLLKSIISPIIVSMFFYYLIRPLYVIFTKKGLKNSEAAVLTLLIWTFTLVGIFYYFGSSISYELNGLIKEIKTIGDKENNINKALDEINKYIDVNQIYKISTNSLNDYMKNAVSNLLKGFKYLMDSFSKLLLILVTIFYLLKDGEKFKKGFIRIFKDDNKGKVCKILEGSHTVLSQYVIGQSKVALSLSTLIFLGYKIIGMPNALLFSSITFILAFIPFVGFFISMIIPTIIALSLGFSMAIKLAATFVIVQTLKGRVVVPAIMGHTMKIHPLTDIFLVIGAIAFGGPLAAFIIVPIYGIIKVIIDVLLPDKTKKKLSM